MGKWLRELVDQQAHRKACCILQWVSPTLMLHVSAAQCTVWAAQQHRALRQACCMAGTDLRTSNIEAMA
jgi:hypothetical protein